MKPRHDYGKNAPPPGLNELHALQGIETEITEIGQRLDIPRNHVNPLIAEFGKQRRMGNVWEPVPEMFERGFCVRHQWRVGEKSGINIKWRFSFIKELFGR